MKPREEGKIKSEAAEDIVDVVKTVGRSLNIGCPTPNEHLSCRQASAAPFSNFGRWPPNGWPAKRTKPVAAPDPKDKRFTDPEWSQNQFFDFLKQVYLLSVQWAERMVRDAQVDEHTRAKAAFYIKQIANAISPTNFVLTNPELLRETLD